MINVLFKKLNNARFRLFLRMTALILLVAVYMAMPVYAWFYQGRSALAVSLIDDPTSIHIDAANVDDIRYLDLSSIDVEKDPEHLYTDRVFAVSGSDVGGYRLQLAYTTNNQFEYELYPASLNVPAGGSLIEVEYITHPSDGSASTTQTYYVDAGTSPLPGVYKNKKTLTSDDGTEDLAYTHSDLVNDAGNLTYHDKTYKNNGETTDYRKINKYAEPIYWQTTTTIAPQVGEFVDYYVLRIKWKENATNTKETDIIYISARNVSE